MNRPDPNAVPKLKFPRAAGHPKPVTIRIKAKHIEKLQLAFLFPREEEHSLVMD